MKSKKIAVTVGVAFGIAASFLAMIPSSHRSEAAIAVIDQKNIVVVKRFCNRSVQ